GAVALTGWSADKVEVLAQQEGEQNVSFCAHGAFTTPDGGFWCTDCKELLRLVKGKWRRAGTAPDASIWDIRVLGPGEPPWVLHSGERLYGLRPGKAGADAVLEVFPLSRAVGKVYDGLALSPGKLLLATDLGLRILELASGKLTGFPSSPPKGKVRALCRDG